MAQLPLPEDVPYATHLILLDASDADFVASLANEIGVVPCRLLREVADYAKNELDAKAALLEKNYVDVDYLSDYSAFYSKSFQPPPSKCSRVHFFGTKVQRTDLLTLDSLQDAYLGYLIIRPTGHRLISRTCLRVPNRKPNAEYVLCKYPFKAHVNGRTLSVEAFPFVTQDANTFVCAGAAMWMQAFYMHDRLGFPRYYPAQITEIARRYSVGGHVRGGLRPTEMATALRDMGFNPHVYRFDLSKAEPTQKDLLVRRASLIAHAVVESRLPCIIGVFGDHPSEEGRRVNHAITAIGHSFQEPDHARLKRLQAGKGLPYMKYAYSGDYITWFVVNDDQRSPYRRLWVWKKPKCAEPQDFCLSDMEFVYLIVPMPREVSMEFEHGAVLARPIFGWWNKFVNLCVSGENEEESHCPQRQKVSNEWLVPEGELEDLVFRPYLDRGQEFKRWVEHAGMHEEYKKLYRSMQLPKYVWVFQVAEKTILNAPREEDRLIRGEMLIDSTANPHSSRLEPLLAFHYRGRFAINEGCAECPRVFYRPDEPREYDPGQRGAASAAIL